MFLLNYPHIKSFLEVALSEAFLPFMQKLPQMFLQKSKWIPLKKKFIKFASMLRFFLSLSWNFNKWFFPEFLWRISTVFLFFRRDAVSENKIGLRCDMGKRSVITTSDYVEGMLEIFRSSHRVCSIKIGVLKL